VTGVSTPKPAQQKSTAMLRNVVKSMTPPLVLALGRKILGSRNGPAGSIGTLADQLEHEVELIDLWANTSLFALEVIQHHGPLKDMRLLSIGNRMTHLADYVALFDTVYHNTLLNTLMPDTLDGSPRELKILKDDFFDLPPLEVDCVISQAALHCLNDTRYGNEGSASGWQRPYQAAAKLREIIGSKSIPVVVSIATHRQESLIDDNARLAHDKFVQSFVTAGFSLQDYFFDYLCYGMPARVEYMDARYRRAKELPTDKQAASEYNYVIGNYYFL
jgi:hypothetical protein